MTASSNAGQSKAGQFKAEHIARFGTYGAWGWFKQFSPDEARQIEELGYGTIWLGGSPENLHPIRTILEATENITVATGIVNIWNSVPYVIAGEFHALERDFPGRFYLGIGAGHPEATSEYTAPFKAVGRYLDALDGKQVPPNRRLLAALGPRMLRMSAERSLGAHPYLTTPEHTAQARELLGPDALLAPEHKVVLTEDAQEARAVGRPPVDKPYLHLRNYSNNLKRLGYTDEDIADGGSDALIDDLVAHGTAAQVKARLDEHLAAGANHVAIQVLGSKTPVDQLAAIITA